MSNSIPINMIFDTFKKILKEKGMTYSDLAKKLHLSESGIKKIFIAQDCSYSRLNEISDVLEISLVDIMSSNLDNEIKEVHFTLEQEKYFIKHPALFNFFWKLVQERESLASIKKEFNLSEKEIFLLLKKLDEFGILELHAKNKIKIPKMEKVRWMGDGPLLKWIKTEWPKKIIQDVISKKNLDGLEHYSLRYYQLTKKSQEELVQAIKELDHEFAERSLREFKSGKKLSLVRMVSAVASGSYVSEI
jgi:transcriptional regulator with XRE-family HTH domain